MAAHITRQSVWAMQSSKQFIGYFERMKKAEDILCKREKMLMKTVIENTRIQREKLKISKEQWILGSEFVADHLEWDCEQGIVVFEIESKPLTTKYAVRFQ